jgi:hypothetical protein
MTTIPQAVFAGILFKVGYDVFDQETLLGYLGRFSTRGPTDPDAIFVAHKEMLLICFDKSSKKDSSAAVSPLDSAPS